MNPWRCVAALVGALPVLGAGALLHAQQPVPAVAASMLGSEAAQGRSAATGDTTSASTSPASKPEAALPDAPAPQTTARQAERQATRPGFPPVSPTPGPPLPQPRIAHPEIPSGPAVCVANLSTAAPTDLCCARKYDAFDRFLSSTDVHPLTVRQKGLLAVRNTIDPYNFATIAFNSAIYVASDAHSPYGPGMPGFARNFGVAYTENATSEFFGTFLIPSITHQDPHYHRLPNASYQRRIVHAITQVAWGQDDYGKPLPNYSTLIGTAAVIELGNLYVPGRHTNGEATANRYLTSIATAPIGNFITEFVPDVARRVNIHIVLIQAIIDRVERNP